MSFGSVKLVASGHNAWRRHVAFLFFIPAVLSALLLSDSNSSAPSNWYSLAESAATSNALLVLAPFVCLSSAVEMQVLSAIWGRIVTHRSWSYAIVSRLLPVLILGVTSVLFVSAYFVRGAWITDAPGWQYPVLSLAVLVAWTTLGAALGLVLRPVLAYPIAALLPFIALTLPAAGKPLWLRHLSGLLFDCCGTGDVLNPSAVAGALLTQFGLALIAISIIWLRLGPRRPSWIGVSGLAMLGVIVVSFAASTVSDLGPSPTEPRSQKELVCADRICLWPEDESSRIPNALAWRDVRNAWNRLGIGGVSSMTFISSAPGDNRLSIASSASTAEAVAQSMVQTLPRELASCGDKFERQELSDAFDQLSLALSRQTLLVDEIEMFGGAAPPLSKVDIDLAWQLADSC